MEEIKTKEETIGILHELLEWIGPVKEQIENTECRNFTFGETLALADVMNALNDLEVALSELDRIVII